MSDFNFAEVSGYRFAPTTLDIRLQIESSLTSRYQLRVQDELQNENPYSGTYNQLITKLKKSGLKPFEEMTPPEGLEAWCTNHLCLKIGLLYGIDQERKFTEALALAQSCEKVGYKDLTAKLLHNCILLNDWNNLPIALAVSNADADTVLRIAKELSKNLSQSHDSRGKLKVAMKVLDLDVCKADPEAQELKFNLFCQLAGSNMGDPELKGLMANNTTESLFEFADARMNEKHETRIIKAAQKIEISCTAYNTVSNFMLPIWQAAELRHCPECNYNLPQPK